MSLINEALKRAQEAQRPHSSPRLASLSAPPDQPQETPFPSRTWATLLLLMAGGLLLAGLSLLPVLFGLWLVIVGAYFLAVVWFVPLVAATIVTQIWLYRF